MANRKKQKKNHEPLFFPTDCGWMRDVKSERWFFYLPAEALEDIALLEILLEELHQIDPRDSQEIEDIH